MSLATLGPLVEFCSRDSRGQGRPPIRVGSLGGRPGSSGLHAQSGHSRLFSGPLLFGPKVCVNLGEVTLPRTDPWDVWAARLTLPGESRVFADSVLTASGDRLSCAATAGSTKLRCWRRGRGIRLAPPVDHRRDPRSRVRQGAVPHLRPVNGPAPVGVVGLEVGSLVPQAQDPRTRRRSTLHRARIPSARRPHRDRSGSRRDSRAR